MSEILTGAGWFLIPLGLCSLAAIFISIERLLALRTQNIVPSGWMDQVTGNALDFEPASTSSVMGRLIAYYQSQQPDSEALKSFARLETVRLERGLFVLEVVVGAAPLLGLLGTVTGLIQVFSGIDPGTGLPDPAIFVEGIAMALGTTALGLIIAIPAMAMHALLYRRVDLHAVRVAVAVEQLMNHSQHDKG